jgi:hypothetical protein
LVNTNGKKRCDLALGFQKVPNCFQISYYLGNLYSLFVAYVCDECTIMRSVQNIDKNVNWSG